MTNIYRPLVVPDSENLFELTPAIGEAAYSADPIIAWGVHFFWLFCLWLHQTIFWQIQ
jgi:hypothetical protein